LQAGDLILLCSDGLWSVLPDHVLAQRLNEHTIVRAIPELIHSATDIAGKQSDNVTALAMMWEGTGNLDDASIISTNTLPVGSMTTTIQATSAEDMEAAEVDIFNDAEIEKAIAEIRNAIHKSSRITTKN
jgi:serine/threonine protein phosphatase PrpC